MQYMRVTFAKLFFQDSLVVFQNVHQLFLDHGVYVARFGPDFAVFEISVLLWIHCSYCCHFYWIDTQLHFSKAKIENCIADLDRFCSCAPFKKVTSSVFVITHLTPYQFLLKRFVKLRILDFVDRKKSSKIDTEIAWKGR